MKLTNDRLNAISARVQPLIAAEVRSRGLEGEVPPSYLFVGLNGVSYTGEAFEVLPGFLTLRQVTNPPGLVHVTRASSAKDDQYLSVGRYSYGITVELAAGSSEFPDSKDPEFLHAIAFHTAALVKLRGHENLFCPVSATTSWDLVASAGEHSVRFRLLDDVPSQIRVGHPSEIIEADLIWAREYWDQAFRMRDGSISARFGLAFNVAYTWNHTLNPRIAISSIWVGLEALFGNRTDRPVTRTLVDRIVSWLGDVSESEIFDLYNSRCDAVHGRPMDAKTLRDTLQGSSLLLRRSVVRCIESEERTLPDWGS